MATDFEALKTLVPDRRIQLCELELSQGLLMGRAEKQLEPSLKKLARDHHLKTQIRFLKPAKGYCKAARAYLRKAPKATVEVVSELIYGEALRIFDTRGSFVRVASERDGYLGWLEATALAKQLPTPSHRFIALRGHLYDEPSVSSRPLLELAYGARLKIQKEHEAWSEVLWGENQKGFVKTPLLSPLCPLPRGVPEAICNFAKRFLRVPYLWGGTTAWGLDCSGLVQTVFAAFGIDLPRDSDQQESCGSTLKKTQLRAGDLLFFPGHVAIALSKERFLHANAFHMCVSIDAVHSNYGKALMANVTSIKRLV